MAFDFEYNKMKEELHKIKPKRVLVQLPEGIKQKAFEVKKEIEELGIEVIFSGETAWGGCCISAPEAKIVGADLIIHFGHAKFIESNFPVLYMEIPDEIDLSELLEQSLEKLAEYFVIGLSYSIQHKHDVEKIKEFYENHGKEIILSEKKGFAAYSGHIVGCEYGGLKIIQDKVDAFLIIGNNFHSMGASLAVEKPVILLDIYNNWVTNMEGIRDKILKQRIVAIDKFKHAKKVGIIIEIKPGQKFGSGKIIKKRLENAGKEVVVITMNEITKDKLANFYDIKNFVSLACPRIAVDDFGKYEQNIVTYKEALIAIGEKDLNEEIKKGLI